MWCNLEEAEILESVEIADGRRSPWSNAMTAPPAVIWQMFKHPLTDKGIEGFLKDWAASGQSIG